MVRFAVAVVAAVASASVEDVVQGRCYLKYCLQRCLHMDGDGDDVLEILKH